MHHTISYISLPSLHHYYVKLPNFMISLYGVREHNTRILALYF